MSKNEGLEVIGSHRQDDNKPGDRSRSSDFKSLYINNSVFGFSAWDIQVVLSRVQVTMSNEPNVEEVAVVTMPPGHAKAFLAAMEENLKNYERRYGEIVVADNDDPKSNK